MTYDNTLFKDYADRHLESHIRCLTEARQVRYRSAVARKMADPIEVPRSTVSTSKPRPWIWALSAIALLTLAVTAYLFTQSLSGKRQQTALESRETTPSTGKEKPLPQTEMPAAPSLTGINPGAKPARKRVDPDPDTDRPKVEPRPPNLHGNPQFAIAYAPFGLPDATHVFLRSGYALGFSDQSGIARWVAYKTQIGTSSPVPGYAADRELERAGVAQLEHNAKREGYVRGAFIPASHLSGLPDQESLRYFSIRTLMAKETNSLLNQSSPGVERGVSDTYVITGCIEPTRSQDLYLADAFFRISYRLSDGYPVLVQAYIVPNRLGIDKRADYRVTIDAIERATGLDFFSKLADQSFESALTL